MQLLQSPPPTSSLYKAHGFPIHIHFRFIYKRGGVGAQFFTRCELRLIVVSKMICLHPPHPRRRCLLRMLCLHTKCAAVSDTSYSLPFPLFYPLLPHSLAAPTTVSALSEIARVDV